jgi:phosphoribosylglycinamide formyltransferase-1
MMRIAVLASHEGSLLQAVIDACRSGELAAEVVLVVSNNSASGALRRAAEAGIDTAHLSSSTHPDPEILDRALCTTLTRAGTDLVLLAGYMKRVGPRTLERFSGRIVNTHPALLPKYGGHGYFGRRVHEAVIAAGETESGATVHWVQGDYDSGPPLAQTRIPVRADDTAESLEARVKAAERQLLIDTLKSLANQRLIRHA